MNELKTRSDDTIISELKNLVKEERKMLTAILHHLKEVEERRLYLERGHSSLFAFITAELGYSESAAQRRIQAMRLMRAVPVVEEKLESGTLSLSVASQVQSFIYLGEKSGETLSQPEKLDLIAQLEGTSSRECEKKLAKISPEFKRPMEKEKPLSEEETLIQFVADHEMMAGIEKLKSLLSHRNKGQRLDEMFKQLIELGLETWDPERREVRRAKRKATPIPKSSEKSLPTSAVDKRQRKRAIPAPIRDMVWQRDQGRCQYRAPETGKVCMSRHDVQIDHIITVAMGGDNTPDNLRCLCRQHNIHAARKIFGDRLMESRMGL